MKMEWTFPMDGELGSGNIKFKKPQFSLKSHEGRTGFYLCLLYKLQEDFWEWDEPKLFQDDSLGLFFF